MFSHYLLHASLLQWFPVAQASLKNAPYAALWRCTNLFIVIILLLLFFSAAGGGFYADRGMHMHQYRPRPMWNQPMGGAGSYVDVELCCI